MSLFKFNQSKVREISSCFSMDLPPITMAGHILYSSFEDFMWSNQQVGEEEVWDSEIPCSFCGRAVFGGIEALYIHYLASHCLQDEVMTCQMPEVNPLPLNPNPILPLPNPSLHIPVTPSNQDNQEPQFVQIQDQCSTTNEEHAPCSSTIMILGDNEKSDDSEGCDST